MKRRIDYSPSLPYCFMITPDEEGDSAMQHQDPIPEPEGAGTGD